MTCQFEGATLIWGFESAKNWEQDIVWYGFSIFELELVLLFLSIFAYFLVIFS